MKPKFKKPPVVWSKGREVAGQATGGDRPCMTEGCGGIRLTVKWPDKKMTFPCTKGMKQVSEDEWEIV